MPKGEVNAAWESWGGNQTESSEFVELNLSHVAPIWRID